MGKLDELVQGKQLILKLVAQMHASLAESPLNYFPATELLATKGLAR